MRWTSIIAIYVLFWVLSAFLVLPFGVRTHADAERDGDPQDRATGTVSSAPLEFRPKRIAMRATVLAVILFGLFYANYVNGWLTVDNLDWTGGPPEPTGAAS